MQLLRLVLIEVEKSKDLIFHLIIPFLAINKLRRSAYLCTPSGNPKLKLWLSLLIPKLFSYPLEKRGLFKKSTGFSHSQIRKYCPAKHLFCEFQR